MASNESAVLFDQPGPKGRKTIRIVNWIAGIIFAVVVVLILMRLHNPPGLDSVSYAILVAVVVLVLGLPPLVLYGMRKPGWDLRSDAERNTDTYDVLVNPEY